MIGILASILWIAVIGGLAAALNFTAKAWAESNMRIKYQHRKVASIGYQVSAFAGLLYVAVFLTPNFL